MLNRRKTLGAMLAAPFAAPQMAKAAHAASLGPMPTPYGYYGNAGPPIGNGVWADSDCAAISAEPVWKTFRKHGIPDWQRQEWLMDYTHPAPHALPHDIAGLRSVSLAHKMTMAQQRYLNLREERELNVVWEKLSEQRTAWWDWVRGR